MGEGSSDSVLITWIRDALTLNHSSAKDDSVNPATREWRRSQLDCNGASIMIGIVVGQVSVKMKPRNHLDARLSGLQAVKENNAV